MNRIHTLTLSVLLLGAPVLAQHAQVSAVAVNPNDSDEIWVCNRDNATVSVVRRSTGSVTHEIAVGQDPRSLAFSADGSKVFVANQRGDIPFDQHFVTGFTPGALRSSVSVVNSGTKSVVDTIADVGTEPYGLAVAPNGAYFAVSGFRSGTIKFYDTASHALLHTHQYLDNLDVLPPGMSVADADENGDYLADLAEPRAFTIHQSSSRLYVTHMIPGFVSVLDLTLNGQGKPTASTVSEKIDLNEYPFHPIHNPVPVQTVESQGVPRFLDDISLSPDGEHALVPHLLHNLNHDVNHDFGGQIAGDFANRVYPAVTVIDAQQNSYGQPGDDSARLHHEIADEEVPAMWIPFGTGKTVAGTILSFNGVGAPVQGGRTIMRLRAPNLVGALAAAFFGPPINVPFGAAGTLYALPSSGILVPLVHQGGGLHQVQVGVPASPGLSGLALTFQSVLVESNGFYSFSNGLRMVLNTAGPGAGKMGHRAGHPSRMIYNDAGTRALLLNRGSEDVFLYKVTGSQLELMNVFPPRYNHVERTPLALNTPMGDLPLGIAVVSDPATGNDDALAYIVNEVTRSLSILRIDWETGQIGQDHAQIVTVTGSDLHTLSERIGQEVFEDASRAQTAGNFNNSCASCHFEGGADGNVWQRGNGPRSTMPVYGGTGLTGTILWKGVRLNMGETGPMFGGENGGHGTFTLAEQQGLIDYHEVIPVPLNPQLDSNHDYSTLAALGKDLFFGTNDTGMNNSGRHAGCQECHPDADSTTFEPRGYTSDFLDAQLTMDPSGLETLDVFCFSLQENILAKNIRNVNSAVNSDGDDDGFPDVDRNADGYSDLETYTPMNTDKDDPFTRDDPNGYLCPDDPIGDPNGPLKLFTRRVDLFSVPTKLGVFSTPPYMHDHSLVSLRTLLDPQAQTTDPVYGSASFKGVQKFFNEFHDIRGEESMAPGASKVQINLQSTDTDADIEALLAYIRSL